jgi:hypothetical protein
MSNDPISPSCNPFWRREWLNLPDLFVGRESVNPYLEKLMDDRLVIRVLVAEDHRIWQEFVLQELYKHSNLQMNDVSANGPETVQKTERLQPNWRQPVRVDPLDYFHKLHIARKPRQASLLHTSRFRVPCWWALTIVLGISTGFLLVRLMR